VLAFAGLLSYRLRRNRNQLKVIIVGAVMSVVFIFCVDFAYNSILKPHQKNRIDVILGKIHDPRGQGYNLNQSKIAIGSGQLWGKGYLKGTQTKYDFVPEQSTDFIFCTVGEEWGFAGCFVVIGLYVFLLLRIIFIAERQRASFTRIYGYGVASIIFFHFFINIGMTVGLIPVIGIPLPFLSYGGSSLWSFTILLFILIKQDSNRMGAI
jgi:rod shape determining protein RodA